jgi:hypothetical protein
MDNYRAHNNIFQRNKAKNDAQDDADHDLERNPPVSIRLGQITPHNIIIPQAFQKVNAGKLKTSNLKDAILD